MFVQLEATVGKQALQDPVVQSIVRLTISLRHKFVKLPSAKVTNTLLFLLKKCENPLHLFFGVFVILMFEILTKR